LESLHGSVLWRTEDLKALVLQRPQCPAILCDNMPVL